MIKYHNLQDRDPKMPVSKQMHVNLCLYFSTKSSIATFFHSLFFFALVLSQKSEPENAEKKPHFHLEWMLIPERQSEQKTPQR